MTETGSISDGYHTFDELYEFRMLYNAMLFNTWARRGGVYDVHKSTCHHDGQPCFGGGWFCVVAQLPTGQITNHYAMAHWDLFQVPARDTAAPYDGHTPQQAAQRMRSYLERSSANEARSRKHRAIAGVHAALDLLTAVHAGDMPTAEEIADTADAAFTMLALAGAFLMLPKDPADIPALLLTMRAKTPPLIDPNSN